MNDYRTRGSVHARSVTTEEQQTESLLAQMELPRVNAVGLVEQPEQSGREPRKYTRWQRWAVFTLLILFVAATLVTTTVSLGSYCLTTDGGDTRALPWGSPSPQARDGEDL